MFTLLTLSPIGLINPIISNGERTNRLCVEPMCAVFVFNFNKVLKTICNLMTISHLHNFPQHCSMLPFQFLVCLILIICKLNYELTANKQTLIYLSDLYN